MNVKWEIEWIQVRIQLKVKDYKKIPNDDGDEDRCLGLQ